MLPWLRCAEAHRSTDHHKHVQQQEQLATAAATPQPKLDLGLREGQAIHVNIKTKGGQIGSGATSTVVTGGGSSSSSGGGGSGGLAPLLPPPPGARTAASAPAPAAAASNVAWGNFASSGQMSSPTPHAVPQQQQQPQPSSQSATDAFLAFQVRVVGLLCDPSHHFSDPASSLR